MLQEFEKDENFEVKLTEVVGNCELDKRKTRCVATIVNDDGKEVWMKT